MPIENGVGYSEATKIKQEHFRQIIKTHLKISKSILKRYEGWADKYYHYFDLNAGPGFYDGILGSPLIFISEALRIQKMNIKIVCCEINKNNYNSLCQKIAAINMPERIKTIPELGDNRIKIQDYYVSQKQKRFGIAYHDPSGEIPDFGLLADISKIACYEKLDFLINYSPTNHKRIRCHPLTKEKRTLKDFIQKIDKNYWIIREPYHRHQWTMLIASNWNAFPVFKNLGFHEINSPKGQELLSLFNYTQKEAQDETENRRD